MIEIKEGVVFKDGKEVGTIGHDGKFIPADGLHHKTREMIERHLLDESGKSGDVGATSESPRSETSTSVSGSIPTVDPPPADIPSVLEQRENRMDVLRAAWGDHLEANIEKAGDVADMAGLDPLSGVFNDPDLIIGLYRLWEPLFGVPVAQDFHIGDGDPEPTLDPLAGDKTPAYVEWFARNHSEEEFAKKYPAHRKVARPE